MNGSRPKRAELALALLVLVVGTVTCRDAPSPTAPPDRPSFIINGQPTGDNTFSNVGALLFDFDQNGVITGDDALCSGSLIAPTVFLTAAHCVSFFPANAQLYVSFSADLFDKQLKVIAATEFHFDPGFGHDLGDLHDVAVVLLPAGSTTTIQPLQLPPAGLLDDLAAHNGLKDQIFLNVGYGVDATLRRKPRYTFDGVRKVSKSPSSCSPQGRPRPSSRCNCTQRGCSTTWPPTTGSRTRSFSTSATGWMRRCAGSRATRSTGYARSRSRRRPAPRRVDHDHPAVATAPSGAARRPGRPQRAQGPDLSQRRLRGGCDAAPEAALHVRRGTQGLEVAVVLLPAGSTTTIQPLQLHPAGLLDDLAAHNGLKDQIFLNVGYGVDATLRRKPRYTFDGVRKVSKSPSSCSPQGRPRPSSRCNCTQRGCSTTWPPTTGSRTRSFSTSATGWMRRCAGSRATRSTGYARSRSRRRPAPRRVDHDHPAVAT